MSVAEMKLKAINHLNNLTTEEAVKGILEQLEKQEEQERMSVNLAQHYFAIKKKYGSVLQKLAE